MTEIKNNPHQTLIKEKVAELIEKVKSINSECAFEAEEKFAYQQGFQDAIAMFYIDLTGTPKTKGTIQATIDTVLEEERERITSVIQERVDYYTNGTGKAGYQITGEYPKTGDERLEMRLQAYFEVNQALTPLPDKE